MDKRNVGMSEGERESESESDLGWNKILAHRLLLYISGI